MLKKTLLITILSIFLLLIVPSVLAQAGHMKLLAVSEDDNGNYRGSIADLYLEVRPGTGRVYLQTFPLMKVDTQISTRFAKEMACKFLDKDCNDFDFFYTIEAPSTIIGGPSAGSSMAVLTIAVLEDLPLDPSIALTGTINSGGIIGPVSGLQEKIEVSKTAGIRKVLIPMGLIEIEKENQTVNLFQFGKEINISVAEVPDINDAVFEFTGKRYYTYDGEINISEDYSNVMQKLSQDLCFRADELNYELNSLEGADTKLISEEFLEELRRAENLSLKGRTEQNEGNFYSAASFCFGSNVQFKKLIFLLKDMSNEELNAESEKLSGQITEFKKFIDSFEIKTITDLQAQMIVNERLFETKKSLEKAENNSAELAYASERFYSAVSWSKFLNQDGEEFEMNPEELKKSCMDKINEVEERLLYAKLFFPGLIKEMQFDLQAAQRYYSSGDYAICLFKASQTKADANILLAMVGLKEENFDSFLGRKLEAAKNEIVKQTEKGVFPIVAYSYYEYALSLKESTPYSAIVYAEYALELSNLDIYFKKKAEATSEDEPKIIVKFKNNSKTWFFIIGLILGFLLAFVIFKSRIKPAKHIKHTKTKSKLSKPAKTKKVKPYKPKKPGKRIKLKR